MSIGVVLFAVVLLFVYGYVTLQLCRILKQIKTAILEQAGGKKPQESPRTPEESSDTYFK